MTYTGQQFDGITNQYYLRARFYNPVIGRFTQEDVYRGDGLDLYSYCVSNPVGYCDTSGYTNCDSKTRAWNDFQKDNKGKYHSQQEMVSAYYNANGGKLKLQQNIKGRGGKQKRLREIVKDDKVSCTISGEIKRDINEIKKGKRGSIRVPSGYEMAHKRGYEARNGYGYEHSDLQIIENHRTQHKIDGYGKKG
ncbi:polymorphic toxin type 8 domain-containing protein [Clostridium estertheticum]|uniref:polymorphic toxin type 8 domain-containing protein n=1 Tax=Clostridium estertheticum TaxID=238834 RepID=UPI002714A382|nr:polymorphic toxin type 8 domain-containing protein [Clostridium estertheticum]